MGALTKALSPQSSHAAKKSGLWDELTDELEGCMYPAMVDAFEAKLSAIELQIPGAWHEPLADLIEKKREALAAEDIGQIVRTRFDFT